MNYIKIDNCKDKKYSKYLKQICYWHNETPKLWLANYKITQDDINETINSIKEKPCDEIFIIVALDNKSNIKGFIWANKTNKVSVFIMSLYVCKEYRGMGIATRLKKELEDWCIKENIKTVKTTVHHSNDKMINLNNKLGYKKTMITMTKQL